MVGTLKSWKFFVTCNLVFLLWVYPSFAHGRSDAGSARGDATCWYGPVPDGTDPCRLIDQAQGFLLRLSISAESHVRELAAGLDVERSLHVQQRLLREHLAWLDEELTKRQLDLTVFLTVALSLDRAQARTVELHKLLEENSEPRFELSLQNVELYRSQALSLLGELSSELEGLSDRELGIRL